jgi:hypothetical protein
LQFFDNAMKPSELQRTEEFVMSIEDILPDNGKPTEGLIKRWRGRSKDKRATKAPRVQRPEQHEVVRPKRQVPPVVKRTYGSLHALLRVFKPTNAFLVALIMCYYITVLHGWGLFSPAGVGVGLALVLIELVLFAQVWKHYQRVVPGESKQLLYMGFYGLVMLAVAGAAVTRWPDYLNSYLLVLAWLAASTDPMELADTNAEKRSIRQEIEAANADKTAAADANLQSATAILERANALVPNINTAFDKANEATANATTLIGMVEDKEETINRRAAALSAAEKPAMIAQLRVESQGQIDRIHEDAQAEVARIREDAQAEVARIREDAQQQVNRISQELQERYSQDNQEDTPSQPASVPSATQPQPSSAPSPTNLPRPPGQASPRTSHVPASDDIVQGQVSHHN